MQVWSTPGPLHIPTSVMSPFVVHLAGWQCQTPIDILKLLLSLSGFNLITGFNKQCANPQWSVDTSRVARFRWWGFWKSVMWGCCRRHRRFAGMVPAPWNLCAREGFVAGLCECETGDGLTRSQPLLTTADSVSSPSLSRDSSCILRADLAFRWERGLDCNPFFSHVIRQGKYLGCLGSLQI